MINMPSFKTFVRTVKNVTNRRNGARLVAVTILLTIVAPGLTGQRRTNPSERDSRDLLLAALGSATIECLGTVGPTSYSTATGVLARTFRACRSTDPAVLARVDALLGVQFSAEGRVDHLADHYIATWNAFTASFPDGRIGVCPTWRLINVIDAPTTESVARYMDRGWNGEENRRYEVSSPQCATGACAVTEALACAAGFGEGFVVSVDSRRSLVEVDPAWWLTHYEYAEKNPCNPFLTDGNCDPFRGNSYAHGYCTAINSQPGSLYGALERAGEPCCFWSEQAQKVYTTGKFVAIDCDDGPGEWYCMTYCMPQ